MIQLMLPQKSASLLDGDDLPVRSANATLMPNWNGINDADFPAEATR